eukprot:403343098
MGTSFNKQSGNSSINITNGFQSVISPKNVLGYKKKLTSTSITQDISRNFTTGIEKLIGNNEDSYQKLLNVDTFQNNDFGVGIKNLKTHSKRSQSQQHSKRSSTSGRSTSSSKNGSPSKNNNLDDIKKKAEARYGKQSQFNLKYKELCLKQQIKMYLTFYSLKSTKSLEMSIDMIQKQDAKVFAGILQDFTGMERIQLWSDICDMRQLERKDRVVQIPDNKKSDIEQRKVSQNVLDNLCLLKGIGMNIMESSHLQQLQLVGMKFSREAFQSFSKCLAKSKSLRKLIINQTNIASYGMQDLVNAFNFCHSVEYLDLQCNDLNDSHSPLLARLISAQFEMKDQLKWKLGLRQTNEVNISKIGLKYINLARNQLGKKTATCLANVLRNDEYIRAISLKKNKLCENSINELINVTIQNKNLLQVDLTQNSNFEKLEQKKVLQTTLLNNIKKMIVHYHKKKNRINYEFINESTLGIKQQNKDEDSHKKVSKKSAFISFAAQLAQKLNYTYEYVAESFLGPEFLQLLGNTLTSQQIIQRKLMFGIRKVSQTSQSVMSPQTGVVINIEGSISPIRQSMNPKSGQNSPGAQRGYQDIKESNGTQTQVNCKLYYKNRVNFVTP